MQKLLLTRLSTAPIPAPAAGPHAQNTTHTCSDAGNWDVAPVPNRTNTLLFDGMIQLSNDHTLSNSTFATTAGAFVLPGNNRIRKVSSSGNLTINGPITFNAGREVQAHVGNTRRPKRATTSQPTLSSCRSASSMSTTSRMPELSARYFSAVLHERRVL